MAEGATDSTDNHDPSGDGDGDPMTGDGDGDPTTGDGDSDPTTGDGDDPICGGIGECGTGCCDGLACDGAGICGVSGDGDGDGDGDGCAPTDAYCPSAPACVDNMFLTMGGEFSEYAWCYNMCDADAMDTSTCPTAPVGTQLQCVPVGGGGDGGCTVICPVGSNVCPEGATCVDVGGAGICMYENPGN